MKNTIKENRSFLLFILIVGLIGGYFVGLYQYDSYTLSSDIINQLIGQGITREKLAIISTVQSGLYALLFGVFGIMLSQKTGLWKHFKLEKMPLGITAVLSVFGALLLFPIDKLVFGSFSEWVNSSYASEPTIEKFISGVTYGGVIEEVIMRLFLMSLLSFLIYKVFYKNERELPTRVFIIANLAAALLFAAGHLPYTMSVTTLTPVVVTRCFIMNGSIGLLFGYLYRKYGIGYAMLSHALCHIISGITMFIFL